MNFRTTPKSFSRRSKRASTDADHALHLQKTLKALRRPSCWVMSFLFFVAATPFELENSGVSYLIRASAMLGIVAYAVLVRDARTGQLNWVSIAVVVILIVINLFGWSDRVLLAAMSIVAGTLLGQARGSKWNAEFQIILFVYLIVHCAGLWVSASLFYRSGQVIELHNAIFPHESRSEAYGVIGRLSGFHNEPGTYSQWMFMVIYLFALTEGRLYSIWTAITAISIVMTISLWGVFAFGVIAAGFIIDVLVAYTKKIYFPSFASSAFLITFLAVLALTTSTYIFENGLDFLNTKSQMTTESGVDKMYAAEFMREQFLNVFVVGRPFFPGFAPECISPQDSGLGMTGTYYLGFLSFASLIGLFTIRVFSRWGISFVVPIICIMVWKAHLYEPLLWVLIGYVLKGPVLKHNEEVGATGMSGGIESELARLRTGKEACESPSVRHFTA